MTIYEGIALLAKSPHAEDVALDLERGCMQFRGEYVIDRREQRIKTICDPDGSALDLTGLINYVGDPYREIERLYAQFKRSVPGKRERLNRGCFKALSGDQLSYEELENNMPRREARLLLEGFILLCASAKIIRWHNPNHFFWRGSDPDLIVYRDWITEEDHHE